MFVNMEDKGISRVQMAWPPVGRQYKVTSFSKILGLNCIKIKLKLELERKCITHGINLQTLRLLFPFLNEDTLVMIRQYRYPLRKVLLEFPAGHIEDGEEGEKTDKRELLEETGYIAKEIQHVYKYHPSVSKSRQLVHIYEFATVEDYIDYTKAVATTIKSALTNESVKRQEAVWNIVREQVRKRHTTANKSVRMDNECICIAAKKPW